MLNSKPILRFGLTCLGIYLLLILAGSYAGLGKKYGEVLRSKASNTFTNSNFKIRFKKNKAEKFDTKIELTDKKKGIQSACSFNTWIAGYLPTALLLTLILASPKAILSFKRKLVLLLLGFILINVYIFWGMRIKIAVLHQQIAKAENTFESNFINKSIDFINTAIIDPVSLIMLIPVFIWGILTFRKKDIERFLGSTS